MEITVKIKYGCSKSLFEDFGNRRYLVYLLSAENDPDANDELLYLISKKVGVPLARIELKRDGDKEKVFVIN
jgi:uncharacterized protein YggU (UPF0235/DUF167 family)